MSLKNRRKQAEQTAKATKKIGLVAKLIISAGIAPYGRGITHEIKGSTFRPYFKDDNEEQTREKVEEKTSKLIQNLDIRSFSVGPELQVQVVKDTSLTPSNNWGGGYFSMAPYDRSNRFTHKRHADFNIDFMSEEIDGLEGKEFWAHVAWKSLPEGDPADGGYGGDYSQIREDRNNESVQVITWLPNKKAAVELVNALREGETTVDALCTARGYDVEGMRKAIGQALNDGSDNKSNDKADIPAITAIGENTTKAFGKLEVFTEAETAQFLRDNYKQLGSIDALAEMSKADTGDLALLVGDKDYFRNLMEATGLGEQEALAQVAIDTGVGNGVDIANLLEITETPF